MKSINWNPDKNILLLNERGLSFEDIVVCIQQGKLLDVIEHPNKERYSNQQIFVVEIENYAYLIPYVVNNEEIFLKTIIPSRKATKIYLGDKQ